MNVTGTHVAGAGALGIIAVVLVALGKRIGLVLTDSEATGIAFAAFGIGAGLGHAALKLYGIGVFPFFSRLFHGPKK